ncbi:MAG: chorismate mutase [Firmicutes bacterium]|nr:chorismate mutase [Bacillota bacterium]
MNLEDIRRQIDDVDSEMIQLFCRRMELVKGVAEYKIENGLPVLRPERENEILSRVSRQAGDEFGGYAEDLFKCIMRVSREMQQKIIDGRESAQK